ncbi:MAG: hypothetical protein R3B48_00840 [Kofleriaceae bacterium]
MLRGSTVVWLLMLAVLGALLVPGCGPSIPGHNGYRSGKQSPWRNPKAIKLNDENEGKADGELDYLSQRRAKWYAIDLPSPGDLQVTVEANPANDTGEFDLGMEILGAGNRVLAKGDLEDDDAHELTKSRALPGLETGRYLLHLWLQGRLDNSDYEVKVKFTPKASEVASDFPAQVVYLPPLALVPVIDDTPERPRGKPVVRRTPRKPREPRETVVESPSTRVPAKVLRATMSDKATKVVLSAGSDAGVANGWRGVVSGVQGASFTVSNVTQRTCTAVIVGVTAERVAGRTVVLTPQ